MDAQKFWFAGLAVVLSMFSVGSVNGQTQQGELQTVSHVDLDRYIGTWYEFAKIPNWFQKKCARNTTATYAPKDDGRIKVINRCYQADGSPEEAEGTARIVDTTTNAKLEVSFVRILGIQLFWGDYWIIGLDADYRYAVVGTPSRKYGWILSRTRTLSPNDERDAFEILKSKGYNPDDFVKTDQTE